MPLALTHDAVCDHGLQALNLACDGVRKNMCDVASNELAHRLEEFDHRVRGATRAPVDGAKHFVALLHNSEYAETERQWGWVVVDPTIKQFDERLDGEVPGVAVLPPEDSRRERWYDRVDAPEPEWQ